MGTTAASFSVIGKNEKDFWSQTYTVNNLYLAVEVTEDQASEAGMSFLHEVDLLLPGASISTGASLKDFLRRVRKQNLGIHYVAAYSQGQKLFLTAEGGGEAWLTRGTKTGRVLKDNGVVSGNFFPDDLLVLASGQFVASLSSQQFKKILECRELRDMAETATVVIHESKNTGQGAALFCAPGLSAVLAERVPIRFTIWNLRIMKILIEFGSWFRDRVKLQSFSRKKMVLWALVALFMLSVIWVLLYNNKRNSPKKVQEDLVEVSHKLEEAVALIDLNPLRSRELLQEAKVVLLNQSQVLTQTERKEVEAMLKKVTEAYELALRRFDVPLSPFYELSLIKSGATGADFSLFQDALLILDPRGKYVFRLLLATKTPKIIGGGESFLTGTQLVGSEEEVYVLNSEGVQKIVLPEGNLTSAVPKDNDWGTISDMQAYSGNLYLLDREAHIIWKYVRTETGFAPRQNYLLADTKPDLSGATSLAIDGTVWIAKGSKVFKFVGGEEAVWETKGLDEMWGDSLDLYTDEYTANLYILDRDKKRVLVFDKTGLYLAQYRWQEDVPVSHIVVSEVLKKILLLSSGTIYGIDLK